MTVHFSPLAGSRSRTRATHGEYSRGQSLVEFALVLPLLLAIFLGLMEGGYYAYAVNAVNHSTHEGARRAILTFENKASEADVIARVVQAAQPFLVPPGSVSVSVSGSTSDFSQRQQGDKVTVTTSYDHVPLVGYIFGNITFPMSARSELFVE